jgi:hypothetical protein
VDHIVPAASGGKTKFENLALACPRCNARKWTRVEVLDAVTNEMITLFNPRKQIWTDHFRWSDTDPTVLEPVTPTGRVTVALLDLNAEALHTIRRWLHVIGMHP